MPSDTSDEDESSNKIKPPLKRKKGNSEKQKNLLNCLKSKLENVADHPCCTSKQSLNEAHLKISSLENQVSSLTAELERYKSLEDALGVVKKLQSQAKSILKYSNQNINSAESLNISVEKLVQPSSSINEQVELVPESGVFIEKRKLDAINADASGDGKKLSRNLLMNLFDPEKEIANHSVTGRASNAFKNTPKPPLDPIRLAAILRYVSSETNTDMAKVRASISNKVKEISNFYAKKG